MAGEKTLVKLKGNDAALVIRQNGEVELHLPLSDRERKSDTDELTPQALHLAAVSQLFQDNEFSKEVWATLFARLTAVGKESSPIVIPG